MFGFLRRDKYSDHTKDVYYNAKDDLIGKINDDKWLGVEEGKALCHKIKIRKEKTDDPNIDEISVNFIFRIKKTKWKKTWDRESGDFSMLI